MRSKVANRSTPRTRTPSTGAGGKVGVRAPGFYPATGSSQKPPKTKPPSVGSLLLGLAKQLPAGLLIGAGAGTGQPELDAAGLAVEGLGTGGAGAAAAAGGGDTAAGSADAGAGAAGVGADTGDAGGAAAGTAGTGAAAGETGAAGAAGGGAAGGAGGAFSKFAGAITSPLDFLMLIAWLFNPRMILRAVEFLVGIALMIFGFHAAMQARGERAEGFSTSENAITRSGLGRVATELGRSTKTGSLNRPQSAPHATRRKALRQRYQREEDLQRRRANAPRPKKSS